MTAPVTGVGRNRANVLVGAPDVSASGGFWIGKVVTDEALFPKNATDEWNPGLEFVTAGFISEDGVTKSVDKSTEKIKDWNLDVVIVVTTEHDVKLSVTFLESANADVLKMIYGDDNVIIDGDDIHVRETSDDPPHRSIGFDIKGQADARARGFAADVQVTTAPEVTFVKKDIIKYEVELECFSDVTNAKFHQFMKAASTQTADTQVDPGEDNPLP